MGKDVELVVTGSEDVRREFGCEPGHSGGRLSLFVVVVFVVVVAGSAASLG